MIGRAVNWRGIPGRSGMSMSMRILSWCGMPRVELRYNGGYTRSGKTSGVQRRIEREVYRCRNGIQYP
jgi:hypothetical protein